MTKPFIRLANMIDALPNRAGDDLPLRDHIPGLWPTVGDLRSLRAALAAAQAGAEDGDVEKAKAFTQRLTRAFDAGRAAGIEAAAKTADVFGVRVAPPAGSTKPPDGLWRLARDIADAIRALRLPAPAGAPSEVLLTGLHPYGTPLRDK